jgi:hypothetical protein
MAICAWAMGRRTSFSFLARVPHRMVPCPCVRAGLRDNTVNEALV